MDVRATQRVGAVAFLAISALAIGSMSTLTVARSEESALIAFTRFNPTQQSFALFRAHPDGSDRRRLTPGPAFFPAWSPDQKRLAFDFPDAGGNEQLGSVRRDGSHFRQLTDLPGISEVPDFAPDGDTIVFDRSPVLPDSPNFFTSLWLLDVDAGNAHPLFQPDARKFDVEPKFSPNGRRIVFARLRQVGSQQKAAIFVVHNDGTDERQVTKFMSGLEHPRWSPDGHSIVFDIELPRASDPDGGIWQVQSDGTGLRPVLRGNSRMFGFKPDYSPDGSQILFGCFIIAAQQDDLCVMRANGTHVENITRTPNVFENFPVWG